MPLYDVALQVRGMRNVKRAFLGRGRKALRVRRANGAVSVKVPRVDIHEVVVFE